MYVVYVVFSYTIDVRPYLEYIPRDIDTPSGKSISRHYYTLFQRLSKLDSKDKE